MLALLSQMWTRVYRFFFNRSFRALLQHVFCYETIFLNSVAHQPSVLRKSFITYLQSDTLVKINSAKVKFQQLISPHCGLLFQKSAQKISITTFQCLLVRAASAKYVTEMYWKGLLTSLLGTHPSAQSTPMHCT